MKRPVKEKHIEAAITDLLQLDGWRVWHFEQIWSDERKRTFGEEGMPDCLAIRNYGDPDCRSPQIRAKNCDVAWFEFKAIGGSLSSAQRIWHAAERARGALTIIMGEDCEASIEGWIAWYRASGLNRGKV